MPFYQIYEKLCAERGVSPTKAARDVGLAQPVVSQWKKRGSTPKAETVQKLADYFGVSSNYLLGYTTERVIIPGRLKIVEVNDPESSNIRYDIEAADQEAFNYGLQLLNGAGIPAQAHTAQALVLADMDKLNHDGQQKAVERVRELTEIPRYRAKNAPKSPSPPQEGKDTTPPPDAPETPSEGE